MIFVGASFREMDRCEMLLVGLDAVELNVCSTFGTRERTGRRIDVAHGIGVYWRTVERLEMSEIELVLPVNFKSFRRQSKQWIVNDVRSSK